MDGRGGMRCLWVVLHIHPSRTITGTKFYHLECWIDRGVSTWLFQRAFFPTIFPPHTHMLPLPPTEQDSKDDREGGGGANHLVSDSDNSEHEQVEFTDNFSRSSNSLHPKRTSAKRSPHRKQKKQFATKEKMLSLVEQVCSAQDAVIQQKRAQEGESLRMKVQKREANQARKSRKEAKLEGIKTRLRDKKGSGHAKNNSKKEDKEEPKKDYRGYKNKKRVTFKE